MADFEIKSLTQYERESIRTALEHYIASVPDKQSWSQKVILSDMLPNLMWMARGGNDHAE